MEEVDGKMERKEQKEMKGKCLGKRGLERTGTNCDSRRGRGVRAAATEKSNPKSSERIFCTPERVVVRKKNTKKVP